MLAEYMQWIFAALQLTDGKLDLSELGNNIPDSLKPYKRVRMLWQFGFLMLEAAWEVEHTCLMRKVAMGSIASSLSETVSKAQPLCEMKTGCISLLVLEDNTAWAQAHVIYFPSSISVCNCQPLQCIGKGIVLLDLGGVGGHSNFPWQG